jgi:hypothetical protein
MTRNSHQVLHYMCGVKKVFDDEATMLGALQHAKVWMSRVERRSKGRVEFCWCSKCLRLYWRLPSPGLADPYDMATVAFKVAVPPSPNPVRLPP